MDTTGVIDQQSTGEATAKTETESSVTGTVAPEGSQGQQDNAGISQEVSEGGKGQGTEPRPQFRSKMATINELRQKLRERDSQIQSFQERLTKFEQKFQPRQERKPSRSFWEAPEEVLEERLQNHITAMEERLAQRWQEQQTQIQQTAEWRQETMEATKLVQDTLKLTEEEQEELAEMLRTSRAAQQMSPMDRAEYAIFKWQQAKGIGDRSDLKRRAASVPGTSTQHRGGPRIWSEAEINAELAKFPTNPGKWTEEHEKSWRNLDSEIKLAYKQGRVRK